MIRFFVFALALVVISCYQLDNNVEDREEDVDSYSHRPSEISEDDFDLNDEMTENSVDVNGANPLKKDPWGRRRRL